MADLRHRPDNLAVPAHRHVSNPAPRPPAYRRLARGTTAAPRAVSTSPGDGMWSEETAARRWGRRAITVPLLFLGTALYLAVLPLLLFYAVLADAVLRRPMLLCRFHLSLFSVFLWHCVGLLSLAGLWLIGRPLGWSDRRWRASNRRLEAWWAHKVIGIGQVFYGLQFSVEDAAVVSPGPVLLLSRHASVADTILPLRLLGRGPAGMVMRIVKKRELLWDPCVDVVSHRLPRTFVRRGSGSSGADLRRLVRLCEGMGADDAVVIFPEGTRYSAAKQAEVLCRLQLKNPEAATRAARLRNVLPPRPTGTFALLDARPDMDVVFCAHTGLEGANKLEDLIGGTLLGATLRVKFWRVSRAEVPSDPVARVAWLHDWWERIDHWIEQHRAR